MVGREGVEHTRHARKKYQTERGSAQGSVDQIALSEIGPADGVSKHKDIDSKQVADSSLYSRAYGCLLGLVCGDASGATLEFSRRGITEDLAEAAMRTEDLAEAAMRMPGGGLFRKGPGQITDDSELALSLGYALRDRSPRDGIPLDKIAQNYIDWYQNPYNCGNTCANAFSITDMGDGSSLSEQMIINSDRLNGGSESNGALMRVAPLAVWCYDQSQDIIAQYASQDASLSHPSKVVQDCNAVYCIGIAHLLNHPGDSVGAVKVIEEYATKNACGKVREWVFDKPELDSLNCDVAIGHVKWGFMLALHFLRKNEPYKSAIQQTLMKMGDTDTNAAIVGALLGALHGAEGIPEYMSRPVLAFRCDGQFSDEKFACTRPAKFNASNIVSLAKAFVHTDQ